MEHILLEIRNAGLIAGQPSRQCGFVLIKDPKAVLLADLLHMIDGPVAPLPCVSRKACQRCEDCASKANCRLRRVFAEVFRSHLFLLESLTLADLIGGGPVRDQILASGGMDAVKAADPA